MSASPAPALLAQLIDDYIGWFAAWHRLAMADGTARKDLSPSVDPPLSFNAWQSHTASPLLPGDQPLLEKIRAQHEQLHRLTRLVLEKTPETRQISHIDDHDITVKYREFMQGLRRLERAFAAAASDLDPLTGLRTRSGLMRDLDREISRFSRTARPFCIAIADIDHFKQINDSYGHNGGDRVLASVADHISLSLRAHDDAYRVGGEEFLLYLKEADITAGLAALERLRKSLREKPVMFEPGQSVPVTLSFGLAVCVPNVSAHELLRRADVALYRAKQEGRDRVVVAEG